MQRLTALAAFLLLTLLPAGVFAQVDGAFTWENATELSYAATAGNASTNALALASELTGSGGPNEFKLQVGGIRASSGVTTRTATGTASSFQVNETTTSDLSAASYFAKARYDRAFDGAFVFSGAGWERNTFAGFNNRFSVVLGVGRTWVDSESGHLKTDIGATYTIQKDVEPAPGADDAFAGARLSVDAARSLTATTDFTSKLVADQSVEAGEDLRADWTNSISVAISEGLALKTSYQILYDHQPALLKVPLVDGGGTPTGGTVLTPGDKVDTVLTLALVIKL
jgi:putative salt-induced outer membrane protein YdiY